jgi:hypothetical protein
MADVGPRLAVAVAGPPRSERPALQMRRGAALRLLSHGPANDRQVPSTQLAKLPDFFIAL